MYRCSGGSDLKYIVGPGTQTFFGLIIFMRGMVNIVVELYVCVASVYMYIHTRGCEFNLPCVQINYF